MHEPDYFEEMLATYPAEKRELARKVYQRFADGDSAQFFTQLLLVLDVYARYVERIPKAAVQAHQDSFAILQDTREEIALIAKTIEARDLNITNHAAKTDELCKITQAKCDETVASVELMLKNIGSQVDTKAIVKAIDDTIKSAFRPIRNQVDTGPAQSDGACLRAEDINWQTRTICFTRKKLKSRSTSIKPTLFRFSADIESILKRRPADGQLFPYLCTVRAGDRATEFKQRCDGLGISGVSLHSYRYAWAERALKCGFPERFAQQAFPTC